MLAALELPALASDRADKVRTALWSTILSTRRPTLTITRVLRALGEDVNEVVRAIGYKLYVQKHLERRERVARLRHFRRGAPGARTPSSAALTSSELL